MRGNIKNDAWFVFWYKLCKSFLFFAASRWFPFETLFTLLKNMFIIKLVYNKKCKFPSNSSHETNVNTGSLTLFLETRFCYIFFYAQLYHVMNSNNFRVYFLFFPFVWEYAEATIISYVKWKILWKTLLPKSLWDRNCRKLCRQTPRGMTI